MRLPMAKREADKIDLVGNYTGGFGTLGRAAIADLAIQLRWRLSRAGDEGENFRLLTYDGKLHFELGPCFGYDEASESTPTISFSLLDVVTDELEMGLWLWRAGSKQRDGFDPLVHLRPLRNQLEKCLELIDRADAHVKASKPPKAHVELTVHDGGKEDGRS